MALVLSCDLRHFLIVQKYRAFYGTRTFITPFTRACQFLLLSQINPIHPYQYHLHITLVSMLRPYRVLTFWRRKYFFNFSTLCI